MLRNLRVRLKHLLREFIWDTVKHRNDSELPLNKLSMQPVSLSCCAGCILNAFVLNFVIYMVGYFLRYCVKFIPKIF
jgi:hypothetical protein